MRKKGFTLVEMLAVITILGVVLLVAIPSIQNQVNSRRKDVDERTKQMILSAAENLVSSNPNTYLNIYTSESNKNVYCLTIQTLIDADLLDEPVKDYTSGKEINHSRVIKVETNKSGEFIYTLLDDTDRCIASTAKLELYRDANLKISSNDSENPYPEIYKGMIPVVYDSVTKTWRKANLYTSWYEYGKDTASSYRWANAVTVSEHSSKCESTKTCIDNHKSHSRDYYEKAAAGTIVSMDDITGMYVWIPRYQYKIAGSYGQEYPSGSGAPSASAPGMINVKFVSTISSPDSGYHIPSAFKLGSSTLKGFWMSKFQASTSDKQCNNNPSADNCNKKELATYIVPNRSSWTFVDIASAFEASLNMSAKGNVHGLKKTQVSTHLLRNSEWGAVAYLSQSEYGIRKLNGSSNLAREIYANNYVKGNKYWTGCSAGRPASEQVSTVTECTEDHRYDNSASASGTTSGTIYGVYDMSGAAWEMTAGVLKDNYGSYQKAFIGKTQYLDIYGTTNYATACNSGICYGHALSETHGWYNDRSLTLSTSNPYITRGDWAGYTNGIAAGIFSHYAGNGNNQNTLSFRVAITRK